MRDKLLIAGIILTGVLVGGIIGYGRFLQYQACNQGNLGACILLHNR